MASVKERDTHTQTTYNLNQTLQTCTMNNIIRSTARCLRPGAWHYRTSQYNGEVLSAWARLMCSSAGQKNMEEMVKKDKVVVFMKGTPVQPMCGFSNAVVQILRMHGVDSYAAYNVLDDQDIREGQWLVIVVLKSFWSLNGRRFYLMCGS